MWSLNPALETPNTRIRPSSLLSSVRGVCSPDRGAVGAALEARHAFAQGLSYLCAVALPRPDQFGVHIVASFAATALAAAVFESYLRKERALPSESRSGD